jgi:LacI family transcriptional regulator
MEPRRVTLRDIAAAAGVSAMTVSLALRKHPRISATRRVQIHRLARRMGYRPDPALAALAAYRQRLRPVPEREALAFLVSGPAPGQRGVHPDIVPLLKGASAQAARLGYHIEAFSTHADGATPETVARVLLNRGIRGVIVAPLPAYESRVDFPWKRFCSIAIGTSLLRPHLHTVFYDRFGGVNLLWEKLWQRGYRRLLLTFPEATDLRVQHQNLATHLFQQAHRLFARERIPPFIARDWTPHGVAAHIHRHRSDVVITTDPTLCDALRKLGFAIPRNLGFASLDKADAAAGITGINQERERLGATSVTLLHGLLIENEYGIPAHPRQTVLEAGWVEGRTLQRKPRRT